MTTGKLLRYLFITGKTGIDYLSLINKKNEVFDGMIFISLVKTAMILPATQEADEKLQLSNLGLIITSPVFSNNGDIPSRYSCEGDEVSPPLVIMNLPQDTRSLAVIVHDPDAPREGGFTHWVVFNIEPSTAGITENFKGAMQGLNGSGNSGYKGMCPPSGTHHYHFKVYALDLMLDGSQSFDKAKLEEKMNGHVLSVGELVGLYKKTQVHQ